MKKILSGLQQTQSYLAMTNERKIMRKHLMSLFVLLGLTLVAGVRKADAQIVGQIVADIPFQFHAGDSNLPAGKYTIAMLENSNLSLMEIRSADGRTSALLRVEQEEAETVPAKTELIFNKYGDQYFLSEMFDEGNEDGSKVEESNYEKKVSKGQTRKEARHVEAQHPSQQANQSAPKP
jgi:hypothetical protein